MLPPPHLLFDTLSYCHHITKCQTSMFKSKYYLPIDALAKSYQNEEKIQTFTYDRNVDVYKSAIILPLKKYRDPKVNNGEPVNYGGVFDENLNFLAGYVCSEESKGTGDLEYIHSYKPDEIEHSDETVIFSGDLNNHFGHFVTDSMPRFWYAASGKDENLKIAILLNHHWGWKEWVFEDSYHLRMLELLGIERHRILIIEKPTLFKSVIVPKQPVYWGGNSYDPELLKVVYDKSIQSIAPKDTKRIYLSRSSWRSPLLNEEYFEKFFSARGFKVLHTQELPLDEQIAYLAGADEIACTYGTLSHLVLFAKPGTKLMCLLRNHGAIGGRQQIIDQMKQINSVYIDASFNFLPSIHNVDNNLLLPTAQWRDFLKHEYGVEDQTDIFENLDQSEIQFGTFFKFYLRHLGSQYFFKHTFGFTFSPFPYLKSLYNSLDPNGTGRIAGAVKITDNPLFRGKYFIYKGLISILSVWLNSLQTGAYGRWMPIR